MHEAVEHLPPREILARLAKLEEEIQVGMKVLEGMLAQEARPENQTSLDVYKRQVPMRGKPAWRKTLSTVPWCTLSWRAMVPVGHFSAW